MDVVALAQHGVEYAVATLGTATTPVHVQKLFRQSDTRRVLLRRRRARAQGRLARARERAAGARRRQERGVPVPARRRGSGRLRPQARQGGVRGAARARVAGCPSSCWPSCPRSIRRHRSRAAQRSSTAARPYLAQITAPVLAALLRRRLGRRSAACRKPSCASCCAGRADGLARRPAGGSPAGRCRDGGDSARTVEAPQRRAPSLVRELIQALLLQPELARSDAAPAAGRRHARRNGAGGAGRVLRRM